MGSKNVITEWDIQALLDNELSPQEEEIVIKAIENDALLQQRYSALKEQKTLLQLWWKDH